MRTFLTVLALAAAVPALAAPPPVVTGQAALDALLDDIASGRRDAAVARIASIESISGLPRLVTTPAQFVDRLLGCRPATGKGIPDLATVEWTCADGTYRSTFDTKWRAPYITVAEFSDPARIAQLASHRVAPPPPPMAPPPAGMPTEFGPPVPGLDLAFPASQVDHRKLTDGSHFVEVRGSVTNTAAAAAAMPTLMMVLRDAGGRIVMVHLVPPAKPTLASGERLDVDEGLAAVPASTKSVDIGWAPAWASLAPRLRGPDPAMLESFRQAVASGDSADFAAGVPATMQVTFGRRDIASKVTVTEMDGAGGAQLIAEITSARKVLGEFARSECKVDAGAGFCTFYAAHGGGLVATILGEGTAIRHIDMMYVKP